MRNSASSILFSRMGSVLCGMATLVITSRTLGPDGRGLVATITSILLLAPILASCGLPMAIRRTFAKSDGGAASAELAAAKGSALPIGALVVAATAFVTWVVDGQLDGGEVALVGALGLCCVTGIWWLTDASSFLGTGRVGTYSATLLLPSLLLAAFSLILALAGRLTVSTAITSQVLAYALTSLYSWRRSRVGLIFDFSAHRSILRASVPYSGGQASEALSYRLDQAVAIIFIGAAGAGHYSIAATIGMLPSTLGLAVSAATFREVAHAPQVAGRADLTAVRVAFLAALPATILAAALTPALIPAVFGSEFLPAVPATLLALTGSLFLVICQGAASLLVAQGRGWQLSAALLSGLAVGLVGLAVLGAIYGVVGAAAASALGFAVSAVIAVRCLGGTVSDLAPRRSDLRRVRSTFLKGHL